MVQLRLGSSLSACLISLAVFSAAFVPQPTQANDNEFYNLPSPHLWEGARPGHYANFINQRLDKIRAAFGKDSTMEWRKAQDAVVALIEIWGVARNAQYDRVGCEMLDPVFDAIDHSRLIELHAEPTRGGDRNEIEPGYVMAQGRLHTVRVESCTRLLGEEANRTRKAIAARDGLYNVLSGTPLRLVTPEDIRPGLTRIQGVDPAVMLPTSLDIRGKVSAAFGDIRAAEIYQRKRNEWAERLPDDADRKEKFRGSLAMDEFFTGLDYAARTPSLETVKDPKTRNRFLCYQDVYKRIDSGQGFAAFDANRPQSCEGVIVSQSFYLSLAQSASRTRFEIGMNQDSSRISSAYNVLRSSVVSLKAKEDRGKNSVRSFRFLEKYSREVESLEIKLLDAMWFAYNEKPQTGMEDEAFRILQAINASGASDAIVIDDAQAKASQVGLGPLIAELEEINKTDFGPLLDIGDPVPPGYTPPKDYVDPKKKIKAELRVKSERRVAIREEIKEKFPDYFSLLRPKDLTIAETQALLGPDEAVFVFSPSNLGTHSFLVTADKFEWQFNRGGGFAASRASLRLLWDVFADVPIPIEVDEFWVEESNGKNVFSRQTAFKLYQQTLGRHEAMLKSKKRVFTLANTGGLANLPFAMLVTKKPRGKDSDPKALRKTAWLSDKYELGKIPTLQTLKILRERADTSSDDDSRIFGIGDPVLEGEAEKRGIINRGKRRARTRSAQDLATTPYLDAAREMTRLPGTREELEAIANAFGAEQTTLLMSEAATESAMRRSTLEDAGLLVFATHGVMARQLGGLDEAALILTPAPKGSNPNPASDGVLTASEIASLDLSASWAVLSACNTATGREGGAPGLSGLSRAFFYAGVDNVLASLWPVDDAISPKLTVGTITLQRRDGLSRGAALQKAMQAVRKDTSQDKEEMSYAHPMYWAPFVLIGDVAN